MSAWIEPFGLRGGLYDSGDDIAAVGGLDAILHVVLMAIDIVTLPHAALRPVGIGTE